MNLNQEFKLMSEKHNKRKSNFIEYIQSDMRENKGTKLRTCVVNMNFIFITINVGISRRQEIIHIIRI